MPVWMEHIIIILNRYESFTRAVVELLSFCWCVDHGQIGDIKTAERYFLEVEEACQKKGGAPSDSTCVLMNRCVSLDFIS